MMFKNVKLSKKIVVGNALELVKTCCKPLGECWPAGESSDLVSGQSDPSPTVDRSTQPEAVLGSTSLL